MVSVFKEGWRGGGDGGVEVMQRWRGWRGWRDGGEQRDGPDAVVQLRHVRRVASASLAWSKVHLADTLYISFTLIIKAELH